MRIVRLLVRLTFVALQSGCIAVVAVAAGGTGALFVKGVSNKSYPHDVDTTYRAVLATLEESNVVVHLRQPGATQAKIHGTADDGKSVKVDLKSVGDKVTEVRLRVGTLGDRARSEAFMAKIDARL